MSPHLSCLSSNFFHLQTPQDSSLSSSKLIFAVKSSVQSALIVHSGSSTVCWLYNISGCHLTHKGYSRTLILTGHVANKVSIPTKHLALTGNFWIYYWIYNLLCVICIFYGRIIYYAHRWFTYTYFPYKFILFSWPNNHWRGIQYYRELR